MIMRILSSSKLIVVGHKLWQQRIFYPIALEVMSAFQDAKHPLGNDVIPFVLRILKDE